MSQQTAGLRSSTPPPTNHPATTDTAPMTHHPLTPQRPVTEHLKNLAEEERQITEHHPQHTWPQTVQYAYHVGRQQAFEQAASIIEQQGGEQ